MFSDGITTYRRVLAEQSQKAFGFPSRQGSGCDTGELVSAVLQETGFNASRLVLEMTENVLIENANEELSSNIGDGRDQAAAA
jgi:EAL domain-containing protein (putative c-di-GMP-specific phosphodiesterase class I)